MSVTAIANTGFFGKYCSCENGELGKIGAVALAVIGCAAAIFSQSVFGAIGFGLFGASVIYYSYFYSEKEIHQLTGQMNRSDQQLKAGQQQLSTLTQQLEQARKELENSRALFGHQISQLQSENGTFRDNAALLMDDGKRLTVENQTLGTQNKKLAEELEGLQKTQDEFHLEVYEFVGQNRKLASTVVFLEQEQKNLSATEDRFGKNATALSENIKRDLAGLFTQLQAWKAASQSLVQEKNDLKKEVAVLQNACAEAKSHISSLQREGEEVKQNAALISEQSSKLTKIKEGLANTEAQLQKSRSGLQADFAKLAQERTEIQTAREQLDIAVKGAAEQVGQLTKEKASLLEQIAAHRAELTH